MRNFKRKTLALSVKIDGDATELQLRPLTDAVVDYINTAFVENETDAPDEKTAKNIARAYYAAAFMLGPDAFEASELADQAEELREENGGYPRAVVLPIYQLGVEVYMQTVTAVTEAAKDATRPIGSSSREGR